MNNTKLQSNFVVGATSSRPRFEEITLPKGENKLLIFSKRKCHCRLEVKNKSKNK